MHKNSTVVFCLLILLLNGVYGLPFKKENKGLRRGTMAEILQANRPGSGNYFEGDIVMPHQQNRNAILSETLKWVPIIPYHLSAQFTFEIKDTIKRVLREFSVRMCIDFVPRTDESDYLNYIVGNGCYSSVGMNGGKQDVSIGVGCESKGVIKHETMHALGFWHEQSRYDRDDYVQILWENIQSGKEHNFDIKTEEQISTLDEPYDYSSLMHYHDTAFSTNGEPTIVALNPGAEDMGQRYEFSTIDLAKLRKLYNCPAFDGWTKWTEWSECDSKCQTYRERFCEGDSCEKESATEWKACEESCEVGQDKDCGLPLLTDSYGIVTSPMFPYSYKTNVECTQTILAPEGHTIDLKFEFVDIEDYQGICYYDWLKIYDGSDKTSQQLGNFCGTNTPPSIKSTGNALTISFFSDISVTQRGFLANYQSSIPGNPLHMCHFEGDISSCGWSNDNTADFQWTRNYGSTASSGTGPSYDATTKSSQGHYLFIETSSPQTSGMKARVVSPTFTEPTSGNCLTFSYNMFGENIGTLSVLQIQTVSGETQEEKFTIVSENENKGNDDWFTAKVNIYGQYPYKLAFQGRRGNGYMGDIAIDDVIIHDKPCSCLESQFSSSGEEMCGSQQCPLLI